MLLLEKQYSGRKLEALASKYAQVIMRHVTKPKNIELLRNGKVIDDYIDLKKLKISQPNLVGIDLEIDSNLNDHGVLASGSFRMVPGKPEISYLMLQASMSKPFNQQHLSGLYDELIEILRHEIEHSKQDPKRIDAISDFSDDPFSSKRAMLDYFGSPEEVAAWVVGWMKKAKQKREPLQSVIEKQVKLIQRQAEYEGLNKKESQEAADELLRKFVRYAMDRYPNLK
jgi:hypothetical protein